jgi:hypothetical protein
MNQLYSQARQSFLTGALNWDAVDVRMLLLSASYVFDEDHVTLSQILPSTRLGVGDVPPVLGSDGYATGANTVFTALVTPEPITQIVLYEHTGNEGTSRLIAYYDTIPGMPFTGEGFNYLLAPDLSFGGFFRI